MLGNFREERCAAFAPWILISKIAHCLTAMDGLDLPVLDLYECASIVVGPPSIVTRVRLQRFPNVSYRLPYYCGSLELTAWVCCSVTQLFEWGAKWFASGRSQSAKLNRPD